MKKMLRFLTFALSFVIFIGCFSVFAFSASIENPMKNTAVDADLQAMGFALGDFPKDTSADFVSILEFTEFGFDYYGDQRLYGLYVYLYNPTGKEIVEENSCIQLSYVDFSGSRTNYIKYPVEILSVSTSPGFEGVFYKMKILNTSRLVRNIARGQRVYKLSGIELDYVNEGVTDKPLKAEYTFTGNQPGFANKDIADPKLYCKNNVFEVVEIELGSASWFSDTSSLGEDYRWEISSVFFNIPDYFINEYGDPKNKQSETSGLYSVKGEYYKYVINGIVVPDSTWRDKFNTIAGKSLSTMTDYSNCCVPDHPGFYDLNSTHFSEGATITDYNVSYNMNIGKYSASDFILSEYQISTSSKAIDYLCNSLVSRRSDFYCTNDELMSAYYNSGSKRFSMISSDYVTKEHMNNIGCQISYDISVDDAPLNSAITSYASSVDGFNEWWQRTFTKKDLFTDEEGYAEIEPIVELNDVSNIDNATFSQRYFTTEEDAEEIKDFYDEYSKDSHIYLMRFEVNPYYAPMVVLTDENASEDLGTGPTGLYYEKAIFEDFDILEFTFKNSEGVTKKFPVSCDPEDILGSIVIGSNTQDSNSNAGDKTTPSRDIRDIILTIIILVAGVIVLVLIIAIISKILGFITGLRSKSLDNKLKKEELREYRDPGRSIRRANRERKRQEKRLKRESKKRKEEGENSK